MIKIKKCYKGCYNVFFNNKLVFEILDMNSEGKVVNRSLWNVINKSDSNDYYIHNSFRQAKEYAIKYAEVALNNNKKYDDACKKDLEILDNKSGVVNVSKDALINTN